MFQPELDRVAVEAFVAGFREATGHRGEVDQFAFADTPDVQTELARLVLGGSKRATAGLQDWTDIHVRYFGRYAEALGIAFDDASLVNYERFTVVWPELDPPAPVVEEGRLVVRPVRPDDRAWVRTVTGGGTADDGWPTDRCPGLLARHGGRTAGVLVFVPSVQRTEVVAVSLLEDAEGVDQALRAALARLRERYGWGAIVG